MSETTPPDEGTDPVRDDEYENDDADEYETEDDTETDADLLARIERLEDENERLRTLASAMYRRRYRRTAIGLATIGAVALLGAALLPSLRTVLVALGATGFFAAVFTYYITPERFVSASVGEGIYRTLADNEAALVDDLELQGTPYIVPASGPAAPARLFVPVDDETPPPTDELLEPFRVDSEPGLLFQPTGTPLYELLNLAVENEGAKPDPALLTNAVGEALAEQFELIEAFETDVEPQRATLRVEGSIYGAVDRFDHPVASLLATTLAVELDTPVTVFVEAADRRDWLVTCRWNTE